MNNPISSQSNGEPHNSRQSQTSDMNSSVNIIVIGTGPVGIRAARMLKGQNPSHRIMVFGEEQSTAYNRVQLSLYLYGEISRDSLIISDSEINESGIDFLYGKKVEFVNTKDKYVVDQQKNSYFYDKLILATGSKAIVPNIPGNTITNTFTFRTLQDTDALIERKSLGHSAYIIGSGPLGIEAAIGMKTRDNRVYLQARNYLLDPSLDQKAQQILSDSLQTVGIHVIENENTQCILGHDHVIGVELSSGRIIECDTVIFCTGVSANKELAELAGLATNKGILVNNVMQTSDANIYAVGECAEHQGKTYGLVAPGFEQVTAMSSHVADNPLPYRGSNTNIKLKFGSQSSALIGQVQDENCETLIYANRLKGIYRKLFLVNQVLVGFIHIGNWPEFGQLQQTMTAKLRIKTKNLQQFEATGILWDDPKPVHIKDQPEEYIVCLCENVTRGALSHAMESGNRTIDSLCTATNAGVTCGSCKPLLAELLDAPAPNLVMRHYKSIYWYSILAIALMVATVFLKPIDIDQQALMNWQLEKLWFDNFWKQVSGYSLLFLSLLAAGITLRKRWNKLNIGHLDDWRHIHAIIGVVALIILMIHTGMRLGNNLNFALMAVFLAATLTGSLVGVFMARNHHWTDLKLRKHRAWWSRVHYTLLWMLPALLGYHILAVYYF